MSEIVDILMGPDPFYLIFSGVTQQPFLVEGGRALAYTDARYAMDHMVKYLGMSGYSVIPMLVNNDKKQIMDDMVVAGVKEISLNESDDGNEPLVDTISNFTDVPPQDGYVDLDVPLINMELSGIMNRFYQELSIRHIEKNMVDALFEKLRTSCYLIPINVVACKAKDQIIFPFFDNTTDIPIFTDYRLLGDWLTKNGHNLEEWGTWVVDWKDLKAVMEQNPGTTFFLNTNTVDMHVTPELLTGLNCLVRQFSTEDASGSVSGTTRPIPREDIPAGKETAPIDDWEHDDPSRDFFKKDDE